MRPREMKRLKKPEIPAERQVYEGAPLTVPTRVETVPAAAAPKAEHTKELQDLKDGMQQTQKRLETADKAVKELNNRTEELQKALEKAQGELAKEREGNKKLDEMKQEIASLEAQLEEATAPAELPELEEITVDKIEKSKVTDDKVMLLCEFTLAPQDPYGKAKAILALDKEQVEKLKKLGGGNGGSK